VALCFRKEINKKNGIGRAVSMILCLIKPKRSACAKEGEEMILLHQPIFS